MTLMSVTDCCRLLSIDGKTLRRWLAQAQLPLQPHPTDARLKGITGDQLRLLATAHHRRLPALPEELATPAPTGHPEVPPPLPRELIELLQTLGTLPAQIAALQQQLAGLTQRLDQPPLTASLAHAGTGGLSVPRAAPTAARSRPAKALATKRLRPPAHVLPLVEYVAQERYVVICPKGGLLSLQPDTPAWFAWLGTLSSFRFVGKAGRLTAHREVKRLPRAAWRAHRQIRNHTYNVRLGATEGLTIAALEQAAATLQAHLK
jgi:hypothetical protein